MNRRHFDIVQRNTDKFRRGAFRKAKTSDVFDIAMTMRWGFTRS
jgi:hypothetical protein